ncbi:MAG: sigma-70 family RNA polymerase sigma factor [Myxococcales bacterium]|nr:MAG: sigma-70 family RNA polymerase sigma factor [Myxococcales bacterium]
MDADDQFIQEHEALVKGIAHKIKAQLDLSCELDDLIAYGFHGLLEAKNRFDAERGIQFNTFAYYRVRGAIIDGVRKMAFLPRRAHARLKAAESADLIAEEAADDRAQNPEARKDAQKTAEALHGVLGRMTAAYVAGALGQHEQEEKSAPDFRLQSEEQAAQVRGALEHLPEREKALIEGFYFQNRNFDEVARELGISKSWASRLHNKALDLLRQALRDLA